MSLCRISKLEIQGFRAFGQKGQTLLLPSQLAALWGANSQGKTSLAEAVEFLLTGQIVRRALLSSSQDEFADSLKNAHLPAGTAAFVEATIVCCDGATRTVRRVLKTDYGKKQDCETILQIDGKPATEADLIALGIVLSQPPLRAPVLAQHTLGYLFSARPQDRATYFKALLEVTDLEEFRNAVAALETDIAAPESPLIGKLELAAGIANAGRHLKLLLAKVANAGEIQSAFAAAVKELIEGQGETAAADPDARLHELETLLSEKRAKTFALRGFERKILAGWTGVTDDEYSRFDNLIAERAKVDEETRRLIGLFREALALPSVVERGYAVDCPLCGADETLTPERVRFVRERVAHTDSYQKALKDACEALARKQASLQAALTASKDALPLFITQPSKFRRERGFRVDRIRTLLGVEAAEKIRAWLAALRLLLRVRQQSAARLVELAGRISGYIADPDSLLHVECMKAGYEASQRANDTFERQLAAYAPLEDNIRDALKAVVDAESDTAGWQELIELAGDQASLRAGLVDRAVRAEAAKELTQALRQIDRGNEEVLDEKFGDLTDGVQKWWDLLRPDEPSFFSGVKPRPGARRTIDFKAGLSAKADRSEPKLRDVVAVFSQSQLHCLGLSLFLARSVNEGAGFVVLDDPILSSDEDYRSFFNATVVEELLKLGMQVIVLTQDQRTWKDLGERYLHQNISLFQIMLLDPSNGSSVINSADDLESRFQQADKLIRSGHPSLHKRGGETIREAAERLCKEILVRDRRTKGEMAASLNDYDRKNLGQLEPLVSPLLAKDPGDPGKLRAIGMAVNPANHDDAIPPAGALKVALGDLKAFKKNYL